MAQRSTRSVLSLENAALTERYLSATPACLDLDLRRGESAIIHVDDEDEGAAMVDLCTGFVPPFGGHVRFLGVDWTTRTRPERLRRRRRLGVVIETDVWPAHMTIMDAVLLDSLYHFDRPREELLTEATNLARLFGLPGLPAERRESTSRQALIRAACVRGFLGTPDLVLVQDPLLDRMSELAVPMAQAISAILRRGGAVLWIAAGTAAAAQFVEPDHVFRLRATGLLPLRRPQ